MALKKKISKDAFEKLPEALQAEYKEQDGEYVLDLDGEEDTGALKRAKDREAQLRKDAEDENKELREKLSKIEGDDARKRGDIETLERSWNKKLEDQKNDYEGRLSKKDNFIKETLVDSVANGMASRISTSPSLILPHIRSRLSADLEGDVPATKILDAKGQPSAMTLEELEQEFVANKDFSAIIIGSRASGSGTSNDGKDRSSRVGATGEDGKQTLLSGLSPKALADEIKATKDRT